MLWFDNGFKKQGKNVLAVFELLRKTAISKALRIFHLFLRISDEF